jgi:hypothetical protein
MPVKSISLPFEDGYRFLDIEIRICTDSQDLLSLFQDSYPRFRINISRAEHEFQVITKPNHLPCRVAIQSQNHQYMVFKTTQGFVFSEKNLQEQSGTEKMVRFEKGQLYPISHSETLRILDNNHSQGDQEHLFAYVQMALLRTLATLMPQHHLLHGAAVTWHNDGIILAGASGQGKSSLSLALVKHGFKFLSDDIAGLNLTTQTVEPFPRSLNLRQRGLPILRHLLKVKEITHGPIDIEALFPNSLCSTSPLRHLFLLKGIQSQPKIKPIPKRQAIWQALQLSHTPVTHPAKMLWQLAPLFNQIHCYELIVGELDPTAVLIRHWLEENRYDSTQTR